MTRINSLNQTSRNRLTIAFVLALMVSSLFAVLVYWLLLNPPEPKTEVRKVAVSLSMFQMRPPPKPAPETQAVVTPTPEKKKPVEDKVIPKQPVKQKTKPKPEPKLKPKPKRPDPLPKPLPEKKKIEPPKEVSKALPKQAPKELPEKPPVQAVPEVPIESQLPPVFSAQQMKDARQAYLNELTTLLAQVAKNTYPRRAKRRKQQGTVLVEFVILPSGKIQSLYIRESSGFILLDSAAQEIISSRLNYQFKPFPDAIEKKPWRMQVPILYQLR